MGCDIHLFVETRESASEPWRPVRVTIACGWCKDGSGRDGKPCYFCKGTQLEGGYQDRNYDTFAILANVRNGRGFAGCDTGDGFIPISEPRGLPADLSSALRQLREDSEKLEDEAHDAHYEKCKADFGCGWFGDHSHSWLSLRELLACDWSRTTKHRGMVSLGHWIKMREAGKAKPESYCGGASGPMVREVSETVADALRPCVKFSGDDHFEKLVEANWTREALSAWRNLTSYPEGDLVMWSRGEKALCVYVPMEWTDTYAESVGRFHSAFIPALVALGKSPDDVRIVFGFDS
jgi:hypothetical protein